MPGLAAATKAAALGAPQAGEQFAPSTPIFHRPPRGVVNNSWRGEDCCWVVYRKAEVRPASWANGAWLTTKRGAAQQ